MMNTPRMGAYGPRHAQGTVGKQKVEKRKSRKDQSEGHSALTNLLKNGNQVWRMVITRNLRAVEKMTPNARESSLVSSLRELKVYPKPRDQTFHKHFREVRENIVPARPITSRVALPSQRRASTRVWECSRPSVSSDSSI